MVKVPLFRAVPLVKVPAKTMSEGIETTFELPSPIRHSPNATVLLVPSLMSRIPMSLPISPT
jgi:hypothetical protein